MWSEAVVLCYAQVCPRAAVLCCSQVGLLQRFSAALISKPGNVVTRDLAKNWDVDIASSLEDYLEDLEDITITLDGGASKVNFAEAALLIQV